MNSNENTFLKSYSNLNLDVLGFVVFVLVALYQSWQASDIMWSFWLISLATGYVIFVTGLFRVLAHYDFIHVILMLPGFLLFLVFFSVHFGLFHIGAAGFIAQQAPLSTEIPDIGRWQSILPYLGILLPKYYPIVLYSSFSTWRLQRASRAPAIITFLFTPYLSVMKIIVLIVFSFFVGPHVSKNTLLLVTLFLFFFPFGAVITYIAMRIFKALFPNVDLSMSPKEWEMRIRSYLERIQ